MDEQAVRIFVAGDICPVGEVQAAFRGDDPEKVFGDVVPIIRGCDHAVANLECPLCEDLPPTLKSGPNLRAPVQVAVALRKAGFSAVGLANNHAMDFGEAGLASTLEACGSSGLSTFGAGASLPMARRLHITTIRGLRVAFLAVAEDERCLASMASAGVSPVDPMSMVRALAEHRGQYDRLVVLLHGGSEGFQYPSPWLRDVCRFLVEQGADVVLCQHSHCIGSMETYRDATILYGQGNFLFSYAGHGALGGQGLGVIITFRPGLPAEVGFQVIEQNPAGPGIRCMSTEGARQVLAGLRARSGVLEDPGAYSSEWEAWCAAHRNAYLSRIFAFGLWLSLLNRRFWMFRLLSAATLLKIYNILNCESHRAAFRQGLEQLIRRSPGREGRS